VLQRASSYAAIRASLADVGAYHTPAIALHWFVALLIFGAIGLALYMTDIRGRLSSA
jgi:cytochrome b561